MPWFSVLLHGENFLMTLSEGETIHGFWTTRFVEAASAEDAELLAVDLVRVDDYLRSRVRNDRDDPPMIYAEKVEEIAARKPGDNGTGYTFYSD